VAVSAFLVERHPGVVDLAIKNRAGIASYVVSGALTLDAAYAGTTTMQTLLKGRSYRSRTLARNKRNLVEESHRGMTRFSYDPNDYVSASLPSDAHMGFIRVAEVTVAGTNLGEGPILVLPPPGYFTTGRSSLVVSGTAPNVAGLANNFPPPDAMIVDFPKFTDNVTVYNDSAVSLYVSMAPGAPEVEIPTGETMELLQAGATLLYLRGGGATAAFRISTVLVNGIQG